MTRTGPLIGAVMARPLRWVGTWLALAALAAGSALAETPRPIRILVGFPPGGGTDAIARLFSERLKDELGVAVLVENRPGA